MSGFRINEKESEMVLFSPAARNDAREIPSAPLRASSSLRLKNGYAQDDAE